LALFTRRPEDSRCIDVASEFCEELRLRCAFSEMELVLIVAAIEACSCLSKGGTGSVSPGRQAVGAHVPGRAGNSGELERMHTLEKRSKVPPFPRSA
jgi:hypothetical protein